MRTPSILRCGDPMRYWAKRRAVACLLAILSLLALGPPCFASTNAMSGHMGTYVYGNDRYGVRVTNVGGGICGLRLKTFEYPDYSANPMDQTISNFTPYYSPAITSIQQYSDDDGNLYRYSWWGASTNPCPCSSVPVGLYKLTYYFNATLMSTLDGMPSSTAFPIPGGTIPTSVRRYLQAGTYTQSGEPDIVNLAGSLVPGSAYEYQAVSRVIDWCRDNLTWATGYQEDALWILHDAQHHASCSGFTHMAIALLRAVGIPARYVTGFSMDEEFEVPGPIFPWTLHHLAGPHAWLEVYYPATGWIPYDAQWCYHWVDTHIYKCCVGIDTENRWSGAYGYWFCSPQPTMQWENAFTSSVISDDMGLVYYGTLATPTKQSFGDWVLGIAGVQAPSAEGANAGRLAALPNPVRGQTTITYSLSAATDVTLNVYSVTGRIVWSRVVRGEKPGVHRIPWNAIDDRGVRVAPGLYFCLLKTESQDESFKMVVLK